MLPKIRIRGLRKRFGDKQVLDGVDLDVMTGTSMVVIGGSGSGKSVLLKCILGLIEPDEGTIEIDGRDVLRMARRERDAGEPRHRHAVPGRGPVRQPAGLGERGVRPARADRGA